LKRYFIKIAYNGSDFFGWQTQPKEINIQDTITASLQQILQHPNLKIVGCGRTDTGVHASQFYFHFDSDSPLKDINKLVYKLNRMLPTSIAVKRILKVNKKLHARFDAVSRTYQYHINYNKDPFLSLMSWQHNRILNIEKMNEAASHLLQYSDFSAFSKTGGDNRTSLCKISQALWQKNEYSISFIITADRFLRNMVRAIVGTLIEVGLGNLEIADFKLIIESGSRSQAGTSVPAKGLILTTVKYMDISD
jgi:tRNA pseudouridine38-40 synthase